MALRLRRLIVMRDARATAQARRGLAALMMAGGVAAAGAASAVAVAFGVHQDPVRAAVTAATGALILRTEDAAAVDRWCDANGGNAPPTLVLPSLHLEGARMDGDAGTMMVTVRYGDSAGRTVAVTWIGSPTARSTPTHATAR
jgi:hypothetical protein